MSELDAMRVLEERLDALDQDQRKRVLQWAWSRYVGEDAPAPTDAGQQENGEAARTRKNKQQRKKKPAKKKAKKPTTSKSKGGKESFSIDRNLDLTDGGGKRDSFKKFVERKKPGSNWEFNAVAVYYLSQVLDMDKVTLDHAYTCYREVRRKPPEHFRQSFRDTKNKRGWLEFDEDGYLKIPHRGIVFVEYDLPQDDKKDD